MGSSQEGSGKTKGLAKGWTRVLVHKACFIEYLLGESCSVPQSCLTLGDPMDCHTPGCLLLSPGVCSNSCSLSWWYHPTISSSFVPFSSCLYLSQHQDLFEWISSLIRWPKYWSFSFSISPSNEYSGLIPFTINWFDLLEIPPRDSQESSPTPQFKSINSLVLSLLYGLVLTSVHDYWKNHSFD